LLNERKKMKKNYIKRIKMEILKEKKDGA